MNFSVPNYTSLEMQIAAKYAEQISVDTETQPKEPKWYGYRRVLFDMDGLVHRVTMSRELTSQVHDEMMIELQPLTGCGIPLDALGKEAGDDPERVGFRGEDTALTCMLCASGRLGAGDIHRQAQKQLLFGAAYGLKGVSASVLTRTGRMSGKSNFMRQLASYQKFTNAMVLGYAAHDTARVLGLTQTMFPRKRRYDASFMHRFARLVLPA